ncbi:MAG: acyl-CoA dehydrogenase family protein [Gemmatimonadota bacterium]
MTDTSYMDWPFFEERHRTLGAEVRVWAEREIAPLEKDEPRGAELDRVCTTLVRELGSAGWLRRAVTSPYGGISETLDVRSLCIIRETLASYSGIADFVFALQGLGAGPITLFGSDELKRRYLPRIAAGEAIAAFAISEADAGSDVGSMRTTATRDGDSYVIDGEKSWISNAGIADFYIVFCRLREPENGKHVALVVDASTAGLAITARGDITAPHSIGTVSFAGCRVPATCVVGIPGKGMSVALGTLDVFRATVGAAALGFARRALDETLSHVTDRKVFGARLADMQLTQARIATMATDIDASALLIYRAAWAHDCRAQRVTREAAMAKWFATEAAQRTVDSAVQLLGGRGVVAGATVERLYREVRALRIYEGTSEIQQLVIANQILAPYSATSTVPSGEEKK